MSSSVSWQLTYDGLMFCSWGVEDFHLLNTKETGDKHVRHGLLGSKRKHLASQLEYGMYDYKRDGRCEKNNQKSCRGNNSKNEYQRNEIKVLNLKLKIH